MRTYDILILGIKSSIGQQLYSLICKDYQQLSVCVPLSTYSISTKYPPNQININYSNEKNIRSIISSCKLIICCAYQKQYEVLQSLSPQTFIDISNFNLEIIIQIINYMFSNSQYSFKYAKFSIKANFTTALSYLFYPKPSFIPYQDNKSYNVTIANIYPNSHSQKDGIHFKCSLSFSTLFFAYLFVILGMLLQPIIYLKELISPTTFSFNCKSIRKGDCLLQWSDPRQKKNSKVYYVKPKKNENAILLDYVALSVVKILQMENYDISNFDSIICETL